jgi:aminoacrylate hydrolase
MPLSDAGLWYEWHGLADGPVVILSPGMGGSASYWAPNLPALSAVNRVLLYDHRGTGRSDRALPDAVTIASMAEDVLALMAELDVWAPHFVGHALGGVIGLDLAARGVLGKLVVINGWADLDPHFARCFDIRLGILHSEGPAAYARAQPLFLYPATWISENLARLDEEAAQQVAHFPPVATVEKRIAAARGFALPTGVAGPVLVLCAADDMLVPATCSRALADRLAEAKYVEMRWGGHACNVTSATDFNILVLDFLGS